MLKNVKNMLFLGWLYKHNNYIKKSNINRISSNTLLNKILEANLISAMLQFLQ